MSDVPLPDRTAIRDSQLRQLRALIAAIIPSNHFYAPRLAQAGINADIESLEAFSQRMPLTTKQDLVDDQKLHPTYGSNLTFPLDHYVRYCQTSGTTATPIRWLDTRESWQWMIDIWGRVFEAAGIGKGDRVLFTFSFGPFLGFWLAFECAAQRGCLCIPGGGMSSEARLRVLMETQVDAICCTPTYAIRLGEAAAHEGVDLSKSRVRRIIVAGEPGGSIPAVRQRIGELWRGARVIDHHGMTEIGPVSYQSPTRDDVIHLVESAYYAEVLDAATLKPVEDGEVGELVLTNLGRVGSPLLRYRTGDLVRPMWTPRGDMGLVGGILGRADDMVVVRSVNVFPSAVEEVVRGCREVAEYQVQVTTQRAMTELHMKIEVAPDCADAAAVARELERRLHTALALRIPVTVAAAGSLPRFEMKAKRWVR